uniref:putative disease resistance protein RGA4 n=1 Tax=Erigeron canadensis TaxID=72917 RepID=UPI001CB902BC|nr:putative disease resistance protein RGA4 [Erigeron canadensis]
MAEIILSALLPVLFDKLAIVLEKPASAAWDRVVGSKKIQSQLKILEGSLPPIQDLLHDAAEKEIQDKRVKKWLNRLQHLAYDIDDLLDSLATDAIHRELAQGSVVRKVRNLTPTCCTSSFSSLSTKMHRKLKDITTELQQLYDQKNDLSLTVKGKRLSQDINRSYQTSLLTPGIVGRDGEKKILLEKLLADKEQNENQNNFSIVPIVGMGGIGKTTLARLLYNEPKVNQHFELKAWVCVSDEFDSFNISKLIFEYVAAEEKKFENPNLLQEALRNKLAGRRFLLVLDDVWSEKIEDWDTLVPPFHATAPGSKIIITTRKEKLLQQLGYNNPYHLNKLSHDNALSLFAQHSLGAPNFDSYPTLRSYGEGIVQKCDGLPLALKSLGSLLRTKTNEVKWKELLESEIWSLKDDGGILPALRLSYLDLSARLKQLFAYSCLFPKDYVFDKEDLILLWMAEGFLLESNTSKSMECLGEEYFDELLSRSFFQHVPNEESTFMMHDLMNDLATSVAGEFFVRLDIEMKNTIEEHSLKKYRHMSFVCEKYMACKKLKEFERANSLRTFLASVVVRRLEAFYLSNKILVDILPKLPLLRVLCLSKIWIQEIPESVGDLKHLRYLNLSRTKIAHIPETVCNLYNLQTLIVFSCDKLRELPNSFLKLTSLRHFDIRDTPLLKNMPLGIGEIKSLQSLSKLSIGREHEFPLSGLKNLKNLRRRVCINGLDKLQTNDQAREVNLSHMRLSELVVEWSDEFDGSRKYRLETEVLDVLKPHRDSLKNLEIMSYGGKEFPKWVGDSSFFKLTFVRMNKCRNCVFLPPLGQLPSLKKLSIESMDDVKEVGSELLGNGPAAFPSLEILRFEKMPRWEVWSVNATGVVVFPCLKELHVRNCPNLVKVSLEALPSLRNLSVWDCGDVLLTSLVGVASAITKLDIYRLSNEVWGGIVKHLGTVEQLSIRECSEITSLWEPEAVESCKEILGNLKKLYIIKCEKLVRIWGRGDEEEGSNLPTSLRMLEILSCKNLKHLSYPDSIETLNISNCKNLEHLSCPAQGGGWQKLKSFDIRNCNSILEKELQEQVLTIINNTTRNFMPTLEVLRIHNWKDLKSVKKVTHFIQLVTLEIKDCGGIESFPDLQDLVLLKDLRICNCKSMDGPPPLKRTGSGSGVNVGVWPPKLDSLSIGKLKRPISEWGPLPTSLVHLTLWGGFGSSSSAEEQKDVKSFPTSLLPYSLSSSLTELRLRNFKRMERISGGLQHLTSLQHFHIHRCPKMKDLPKTLLPSLLCFTIRGCPNQLKRKMLRKRGSYRPLLSKIPRVAIWN